VGVSTIEHLSAPSTTGNQPNFRMTERMTLKGRTNFTAYTFLAIPLLFFIGIRIVPTLYAFSMSLMKNGGTGFTLENFRTMFSSADFAGALWNTLLYVIITVPCQMAFGIILALFIGRVNRLKGIYRTIYFLPYITSAVAISWVWRLMYDPDHGILNTMLGWVHIPSQQWLHSPGEALVSVSVVMIWQNAGFAMLIFMAGLEAIPRTFYEAARMDGANGWNMFWRISWPLLNPTLVFLAVTGVISALQTFTQIANLTGGSGGEAGGPLGSTLSIVVYVYNSGFNDFNLQYASAITVILFAIILLVTLLQLKVLNRSYEY
jgi:multiple sugar transport system permease protein